MFLQLRLRKIPFPSLTRCAITELENQDSIFRKYLKLKSYLSSSMMGNLFMLQTRTSISLDAEAGIER